MCNTFRDKTFTHFRSYDSALQRAINLQLHHVVDHPKVGDPLIYHRNCSISHHYQDIKFLHFTQKFNMAGIKWQENPVGQIFCQNRSILHHF